jgi:hypothetical protein
MSPRYTIHLLEFIPPAYLRPMPVKKDPRDATPDEIEAMMEMGIEEHEVKPIDRGTLQLNVAAMERRLAVPEAELKSLPTCPLAKRHLKAGAGQMAETRGQIIKTKELLAAYRAMSEQQN